jgi:hypothetical protein
MRTFGKREILSALLNRNPLSFPKHVSSLTPLNLSRRSFVKRFPKNTTNPRWFRDRAWKFNFQFPNLDKLRKTRRL